MIRKLVLGLGAALVLVAGASLAPTAALAGGHFFHHHHHSRIFFAPAPLIVTAPIVPPSCWQKRLVPTPIGLRWRLVNVCMY